MELFANKKQKDTGCYTTTLAYIVQDNNDIKTVYDRERPERERNRHNERSRRE